jgi:hypothetical protein
MGARKMNSVSRDDALSRTALAAAVSQLAPKMIYLEQRFLREGLLFFRAHFR